MSEIDLQSVVTVTQGWEPNMQMQAQVLGTLQSRYDANHQKLSNLYGSLLNSPLTRGENIQARDEFFKLIGNDIQKIAGMDLSLQSNVSAAGKVFQSIYANKPLVKDMVWTRNFNDQMSRAEAFKNCVDPAKCGGQYWDEGVKYMQYKRQEFATASRDEAMGFQDVSFVPYHNIMEKAIEQANKAGLSITKDVVDGRYKVTTKNGEQLVAPLTSLFSQLFGQNPQYNEMFKVQAYNNRKDWMTQQIASGTYANEGEAMVGWVQQRAEVTNQRISNLVTDIDNDAAKLEMRYNELSQKYQNKEIQEGDPEYARLVELHQQREQIAQAKEQAEILKATQKNMNNTQNIRVIAEMLDDQNATLLFHDEITKAASTLAYKDHEIKMEEDKFALAEQQFGFDVQLEQIKHANQKELVEWKAKHGAYGGNTKSPDLVQKYSDYTQKSELATTNNIRQNFVDHLIKQGYVAQTNRASVYDEITKAGGVEKWLTTPEAKELGNVQDLKSTYISMYTEHMNLQRDANEKAKDYIRAGGTEDVNLNFKGYSDEELSVWTNDPVLAEYMANQGFTIK